jgi:hypothetical protein
MKLKETKTEVLKIKDLSYIPFNREVNMEHVNKLLSSLQKYGILRLPVVVKTKLYSASVQPSIVDGQHLITALIKAGVKEVECKVAEAHSTEEIVNMVACLNTTSASWKLENFVDAFCATGKDSYNTLKAHKLSTGFNYSVSAKILGHASSHDIKSGKFSLKCQDADKMTKYLIEVCAFMKTNNANFMKGYLDFARTTKTYNHDCFMKTLAIHKDKIDIVHDHKAMARNLESHYKLIC